MVQISVETAYPLTTGDRSIIGTTLIGALTIRRARPPIVIRGHDIRNPGIKNGHSQYQRNDHSIKSVVLHSLRPQHNQHVPTPHNSQHPRHPNHTHPINTRNRTQSSPTSHPPSFLTAAVAGTVERPKRVGGGDTPPPHRSRNSPTWTQHPKPSSVGERRSVLNASGSQLIVACRSPSVDFMPPFSGNLRRRYKLMAGIVFSS